MQVCLTQKFAFSVSHGRFVCIHFQSLGVTWTFGDVCFKSLGVTWTLGRHRLQTLRCHMDTWEGIRLKSLGVTWTLSVHTFPTSRCHMDTWGRKCSIFTLTLKCSIFTLTLELTPTPKSSYIVQVSLAEKLENRS